MKRILRLKARARQHTAVEKARIHIRKLSNIVPKKVAQTMNVDLKNVIWKIDPIQSYIMAIKMQKMPVFAEAVNRNMTGIYFKFLDYKVETKENITLEWKGTQRCLSEDTLIKIVRDNDILNRRLKTLKNPFDVLTYNFSTEILEINHAVKIDSGKKELFEVITSGGRKVKATAEHRLFILRKNKLLLKKVDELLDSDKLVIIE